MIGVCAWGPTTTATGAKLMASECVPATYVPPAVVQYTWTSRSRASAGVAAWMKASRVAAESAALLLAATSADQSALDSPRIVKYGYFSATSAISASYGVCDIIFTAILNNQWTVHSQHHKIFACNGQKSRFFLRQFTPSGRCDGSARQQLFWRRAGLCVGIHLDLPRCVTYNANALRRASSCVCSYTYVLRLLCGVP